MNTTMDQCRLQLPWGREGRERERARKHLLRCRRKRQRRERISVLDYHIFRRFQPTTLLVLLLVTSSPISISPLEPNYHCFHHHPFLRYPEQSEPIPIQITLPSVAEAVRPRMEYARNDHESPSQKVTVLLHQFLSPLLVQYK